MKLVVFKNLTPLNGMKFLSFLSMYWPGEDPPLQGHCGIGKSCTAAPFVPASFECGLLAFQHQQPLSMSGQGSYWPSTRLPSISFSFICPLVADVEPGLTLVRGLGQVLFFLSLALSSWDSQEQKCQRKQVSI